MIKQALQSVVPLVPIAAGGFTLEPHFVTQVLFSIAALAVAANQIAALVARWRGAPIDEAQFRRVHECALLHNPINQALENERGARLDNEGHTSNRISGVAKKIDDLSRSVKKDLHELDLERRASDRRIHEKLEAMAKESRESDAGMQTLYHDIMGAFRELKGRVNG